MTISCAGTLGGVASGTVNAALPGGVASPNGLAYITVFITNGNGTNVVGFARPLTSADGIISFYLPTFVNYTLGAGFALNASFSFEI